jgi:DNA-binding transcriptional ArsR family regulator
MWECPIDRGKWGTTQEDGFMSLAEAADQQQRSKPIEPDRDVVFDILKNRRRRQVIRHLQQVDEPVTIGDLSERLAAWENDVPESDITYKQRKRVYISLHQTHLPKLDECDVIDYEQRSGSVTLTDSIEPYEMHLDLDPDEEESQPTPLVYGAISGLGVVGSFALGLLVFSLQPGGIAPLEIGLALLAVGSTVGLVLYRDRPAD